MNQISFDLDENAIDLELEEPVDRNDHLSVNQHDTPKVVVPKTSLY